MNVRLVKPHGEQTAAKVFVFIRSISRRERVGVSD